MSLFIDKEICDGCKYAEFHSCNKCLAFCIIDKESERNYSEGTCRYKE